MRRWLPLVLLLPGLACTPPKPEEPHAVEPGNAAREPGATREGSLPAQANDARNAEMPLREHEAHAPASPPTSAAAASEPRASEDAGTHHASVEADAGTGVRDSTGELLAAWQRTAPTGNSDGGLEPTSSLAAAASRTGGSSKAGGSEGPDEDSPALDIDPALSALPERTYGEDDAAPPIQELVVISDRKNPRGELVLGPDGEPLEDTSLVLDDPEPSEDAEDAEWNAESASGADAGTALQAIPYAPDAGSLRVRRSIAVRAEPRRDSRLLGTVAQDMRVRWKGETAMRGPDCEAWVELEPRGWVCERYLEPNFREPRVRDLPRLNEGELTPGTYARVVGKRVKAYPSLALARARKKGVLLKGSVTVRLRGQVRAGRRTFWRTADGQYIEARALREYRPSSFVGVDAELLAELPAPFAWAQSRTRPRAPVEVKVAPDANAARETVLPPRTLVAVRELSADGRWVLIAEAHWVARDDLHVAWFTPAPPEVPEGERWFDIDLDAQVLVAYEGERPVYATLISSGKRGTDTPEGLYRIWIKFAEADMTGTATAKSGAYRVATVPWTMFFEDDYALHTAYWHDRFGEPTSHGCINLAPRDAKALYAWAAPEVPTGWSMVHATRDAPGSWVRIRGQARETGREKKLTVATARRAR